MRRSAPVGLRVSAQGAEQDRVDGDYHRQVRAWSLYDWANSAFVTSVSAAILPTYFAEVAGSSLSSASTATSRWSLMLTVTTLASAVLAPVLGTLADVTAGKKRLLAISVGIGALATALLVLVTEGDWLLALVLAGVGRVAWGSAELANNALLPHVARPDDRARVSSLAYAYGYLGGGILLAANIVMVLMLPGLWGPRLSFLTVAAWWVLFSIPLLRGVREPTVAAQPGTDPREMLVSTWRRLVETAREIRRFGQLTRAAVAGFLFLDGVSAIIGLAAIFGSEIGFATTELVLAVLLVQILGLGYTLIFSRLMNTGRSANGTRPHRSRWLAFLLVNAGAVMAIAVVGPSMLGTHLTGGPAAPFAAVGTAVGQGEHAPAAIAELQPVSAWSLTPAGLASAEPDTSVGFSFNGRRVAVTHTEGPDHGNWSVIIDGVIDRRDDGTPRTLDAYRATARDDARFVIDAGMAGVHEIALVNNAQPDEASSGRTLAIDEIEVLEPDRRSRPLLLFGLLGAASLGALICCPALGIVVRPLTRSLDAKRLLIFALLVYSAVTILAFRLDSILEFWALAWLIGMVQGGTQSLDRAIKSRMMPPSRSGEFFGLMALAGRVSGVVGPLLFVGAAFAFDSTRPALLGLLVLFVLGILVLATVDVGAGERAAAAAERDWVDTPDRERRPGTNSRSEADPDITRSG